VYTETTNRAWILRKCAWELRRGIPGTTINGEPSQINYFLNYALYVDCPGIKVGFYTHLEEKGAFREQFFDTIPLYDFHVAMCRRTTNILLKNGVEPWHIKPGSRFQKEITFGVAGRIYPSGRKGEFLVERAIQAGYKFVGWGSGWPCPILSDQVDDLPMFYDKIDYFVVTALNEGGPIPVLDAMGIGVPVIAPDVGWCWEFPCYQYERGSWESFENILYRLTHTPTWCGWVDRHKQLFAHIRNVKGLEEEEITL
jgi:glycosyltransferase involved in cell wall biosynthesis